MGLGKTLVACAFELSSDEAEGVRCAAGDIELRGGRHPP